MARPTVVRAMPQATMRTGVIALRRRRPAPPSASHQSSVTSDQSFRLSPFSFCLSPRASVLQSVRQPVEERGDGGGEAVVGAVDRARLARLIEDPSLLR